MNFKKPRDPNTKIPNWKIRDLDPDEHKHCFVGSGECQRPAVMAQDDGTGKELYICANHAVEIEALEKLLQEMTPNQLKQFDESVSKAETVETMKKL